MNIAIIGTGNIGSGLARTFGRTRHGIAVAGHQAADGPALAQTLATEGVTVQGTDVAQAVKLADVVILAVPFGAVGDLASAADFGGRIVVDVTNPILADFSALSIGHTTSAAEEIARLLPGARVVKAFNTVFADLYAGGLDFGDRRVSTFVASDDEAAREAVVGLATDAGFEAVDAGPLTNARYIEPLGYLNIQFGYMLGRGTQIAPTWLSR